MARLLQGGAFPPGASIPATVACFIPNMVLHFFRGKLPGLSGMGPPWGTLAGGCWGGGDELSLAWGGGGVRGPKVMEFWHVLREEIFQGWGGPSFPRAAGAID